MWVRECECVKCVSMRKRKREVRREDRQEFVCLFLCLCVCVCVCREDVLKWLLCQKGRYLSCSAKHWLLLLKATLYVACLLNITLLWIQFVLALCLHLWQTLTASINQTWYPCTLLLKLFKLNWEPMLVPSCFLHPCISSCGGFFMLSLTIYETVSFLSCKSSSSCSLVKPILCCISTHTHSLSLSLFVCVCVCVCALMHKH